MSTRMSLYYEEDGVHIYHELMDSEDGNLYLDYDSGPFSITLKLPRRIAAILNENAARIREGGKGEA